MQSVIHQKNQTMRIKKVFSVFTETSGMPAVFRFQHSLNAGLSSLMLLFFFWPWPNATYSINDLELTYSEFWFSGMGPLVLLLFLFMFYICFATVKRQKLGLYGVFVYWSLIIGFCSYGSLTGIVVGVVLISVWAWYLFTNEKLKSYFEHRSV